MQKESVAAGDPPQPKRGRIRQLVLVLGDQLDCLSSVFDGFDASCDRVLMIESRREATHVWSHKQRIALFLSAMRHYAQWLRAQRIPLEYVALYAAGEESLVTVLARRLAALRPQRLVIVLPGEYRMLQEVSAACEHAAVPLDMRPDRHFFGSPDAFAHWAARLKELRMEHFYRAERRRTGILMAGNAPVGGRWNFDADNRASFGRKGPGALPAARRFTPDRLTHAVLREVQQSFPDHPGELASLYADGGRFTSKPYVASGAYIARMSNYCTGCRYDPKVRTGPRACPLTVLYWRFLDKHEQRLAANPRTALMVRNVARFARTERAAIRSLGERLLAHVDDL